MRKQQQEYTIFISFIVCAIFPHVYPSVHHLVLDILKIIRATVRELCFPADILTGWLLMCTPALSMNALSFLITLMCCQ